MERKDNDSRHRQRTEQTADGQRRPSRNQAPRNRICEGERFHPVLAGQAIRRGQRTRCGIRSQKQIIGSITPPAEGTERILSLRLQTSSGPLSLISAYAPTLASIAEAKDQFYDDLSAAIRRIPDRELPFIDGDFNARVGVDHYSWPTCLGQFGIGKMNENGQRLLELCCHHGLCVSNTFFNTKPQHRVSWWHPRAKHWHQLDLILTRRVDLSSIKITRSYQSADCDTDHSLVCSKVKLPVKSLHCTRKERRPRIDIRKTHDQRKVEEFAQVLEDSLPGPPTANAQDRWKHFRDAVYNAAMSTFGKKTSKSADWFKAHSEEMTPVIEAKRNALTAYKANPSGRASRFSVLLAAKSSSVPGNAPMTIGFNSAPGFRSQLTPATYKSMYDGIKQALGPTQKKTAPLKSATGKVIQDREQEMERWAEHHTELYARENVITEDALNAVECLPELEELDREPTIDELSEALDSLASGKAPGKDGIPAEVLKCCKETLITELHEILCLCWSEGEVPQDMRDANVVTLVQKQRRQRRLQ